MDSNATQQIQQIAGTFLFYAQGVDYTILPTLNESSTQQSKPTTETDDKCCMLMDYLSTHPEAVLRFHASDMQLHIETDAAYLVLPNARSRAAAYFYMGDKCSSPPTKSKLNGAIHVLCKTIPNVVSSASEAKTGAIYMAAKEAVPILQALEEMGHPQHSSSVPITTDNITAHGILNNTMRAKLSKAYDMRYNWMKDRIQQKQFQLLWDKGERNLADYFTKHHPPSHHCITRRIYLQAVQRTAT